MNISYSQLGKIERGESYANSEQVIMFAEFFSVTTDYLLGITNTNDFNPNPKDYFKPVKLIEDTNIINGFALNEQHNKYLSAMVEKPNNFFYYKVNDDSMAPLFNENDYVLIEENAKLNNNDYVFVVVNDEILVRRLVFSNENELLIPINHKFETIVLSKNDKHEYKGSIKAYYRAKL